MATAAGLSMVRKSSNPVPLHASSSPNPTLASELESTALHEQSMQQEHVIKGEGKDERARTEPQHEERQGQQQEAATVPTEDEGAKKKAAKPAAHKTPMQQALEEAMNSQRGTEPSSYLV